MAKLQGLFAQKAKQHQAANAAPSPPAPVVQAAASAPPAPSPPKQKVPKGKQAGKGKAPAPVASSTEGGKVGKHRDPDFFKATLYVHRPTFIAFKSHCVANGLEMSDIVDDLVSSYLQDKGVKVGKG